MFCFMYNNLFQVTHVINNKILNQNYVGLVTIFVVRDLLISFSSNVNKSYFIYSFIDIFIHYFPYAIDLISYIF